MSKYKVKDTVVNEISELLFEILGRESNREGFIQTLNDVLSPIERLMVGKRILVMYMLYMGVSYDIIGDIAKVSRATIAKFAFLLDKSTHIKKGLAIASTKNKIKLAIDEMFSSVFEPGLSLGSWKSARRLKQRVIEQKEQGF